MFMPLLVSVAASLIKRILLNLFDQIQSLNLNVEENVYNKLIRERLIKTSKAFKADEMKIRETEPHQNEVAADRGHLSKNGAEMF